MYVVDTLNYRAINADNYRLVIVMRKVKHHRSKWLSSVCLQLYNDNDDLYSYWMLMVFRTAQNPKLVYNRETMTMKGHLWAVLNNSLVAPRACIL
jgi:hypothetical protein